MVVIEQALNDVAPAALPEAIRKAEDLGKKGAKHVELRPSGEAELPSRPLRDGERPSVFAADPGRGRAVLGL
jgi:hypothetical protein